MDVAPSAADARAHAAGSKRKQKKKQHSTPSKQGQDPQQDAAPKQAESPTVSLESPSDIRSSKRVTHEQGGAAAAGVGAELAAAGAEAGAAMEAAAGLRAEQLGAKDWVQGLLGGLAAGSLSAVGVVDALTAVCLRFGLPVIVPYTQDPVLGKKPGRVEGRVLLLPPQQSTEQQQNGPHAVLLQPSVLNTQPGKTMLLNMTRTAPGQPCSSSSGDKWSWGLGDCGSTALANTVAGWQGAKRAAEFAALDWVANREVLIAVVRDAPVDPAEGTKQTAQQKAVQQQQRAAQQQEAEQQVKLLLAGLLLWQTEERGDLKKLPAWSKVRAAVLAEALPGAAAEPAAGVAAAAAAAGPAASLEQSGATSLANQFKGKLHIPRGQQGTGGQKQLNKGQGGEKKVNKQGPKS
jgi:hypothetical protein